MRTAKKTKYITEKFEPLEYKQAENYQSYTSHTESIESTLLRNELEIKIYQVISNLPSKLRSPCIMYFIQEMSYPDIAQKLDISMDNVYKRISDARKIMRSALSEYLSGNDDSILAEIALPSPQVEKPINTNQQEAIKKYFQPTLLIQSEVSNEEILHNQGRKCFYCQSTHISKNGKRKGKQNYKCKKCDRQFIESYATKGYSAEIKQHCLNLYANGMSFRAIQRETGVNHNTVINWVKQEKQIQILL